MTRTPDTRESTATAGCNHSAAVLYVCAERGRFTPTLAADRAASEGREFAQAHGLTITQMVTDPYGEPDPCRRQGWTSVRALAETGAVGAVIVRWPACIAPDAAHELRHREIRWLQDRGVQVHYSWGPLASGSGEPK